MLLNTVLKLNGQQICSWRLIAETNQVRQKPMHEIGPMIGLIEITEKSP